jgi:hypothetical protein
MINANGVVSVLMRNALFPLHDVSSIWIALVLRASKGHASAKPYTHSIHYAALLLEITTQKNERVQLQVIDSFFLFLGDVHCALDLQPRQMGARLPIQLRYFGS